MIKRIGRNRTPCAHGLMAFTLIAVAAPICSVSAQTGPEAPASPEAGANGNSGLVDIVVTAQRREERLQNVPIAVNVLTADALNARGVDAARELQAVVPGLELTQTGSSGTAFLRGIGSTTAGPANEPSVTTYVDGIYFPSPFTNMLSFNNIERVEVLKGPQGTLFGRNSTGGVIQVITPDPKYEVAAKASLGYANYDTIAGGLYVTGGMTQTLAMDIAAQFDHQGDGWGRNVFLNEDAYKAENYSVRSKLLFEPTENLKVVLSGNFAHSKNDYVALRGTAGTVEVNGSLPPPGRYDNQSNIDLNGEGQPITRTSTYGGSLRVEYDASAVKIVSLTAIQKVRQFFTIDSDLTPLTIVSGIFPQRSRNMSQEIQILSPTSSAIKWVVGGFLYRNRGIVDDTVLDGSAFPPGGTLIDSKINIKSASVFGQATANIFSDTRITAGLRYTDESVSARYQVNGFTLPSPADRKFKRLTWRAAIDHSFSKDILAYVSYNRGVKGGGFDFLPPSVGFDPETVDAYEVGFKSELFDRHLRINVSVFQNNFRDIQILTVPVTTAVTTNAAKARIRGVDGEVTIAPVRNLTVSLTFGFLDGKYQDFKNAVYFNRSPLQGPSRIFDASGFDTIRSPKFAGSASVDYTYPTEIGDFQTSVSLSHNSGYAFTPDNEFRQPEYDVLNASIGWKSTSNNIGVRVWGRNLTKAFYYTNASKSAFGESYVPAAPRTYGVTIDTRF